jgi:hypothetical protein
LPDRLAQFRDAHALYRRHGWALARVLMTPETLAGLARVGGADDAAPPTFEAAPVREAGVDAMWLKRPSAGGREAWELRLISDPPYALFELFEPDETEEDREDVRREMEARLTEYAAGAAEEGEKGKG